MTLLLVVETQWLAAVNRTEPLHRLLLFTLLLDLEATCRCRAPTAPLQLGTLPSMVCRRLCTIRQSAWASQMAASSHSMYSTWMACTCRRIQPMLMAWCTSLPLTKLSCTPLHTSRLEPFTRSFKECSGLQQSNSMPKHQHLCQGTHMQMRCPVSITNRCDHRRLACTTCILRTSNSNNVLLGKCNAHLLMALSLEELKTHRATHQLLVLQDLKLFWLLQMTDL